MRKKLLARGFSLIEVAIVLAIMSIVLLSLVGLTGTALNTTRESATSLEAAGVATQIISRWKAMLEWNSDPSTTPKATKPPDFPLTINQPPRGVEQKEDNILIDKSGRVSSVLSEQAFNLKYSIFRSTDSPNAVRLYLRLSWPPATGNFTDTRGNYEIVAGAILKNDL